MEAINDQYSVKNLLFYRAIPNYKLPENVDDHHTYACKDCGDRFILESSYQYHIQRKSVQITYKCRHCSPRIVFYNRCNLLSHIRSHTFKTATINVSDLKIDPLPLRFFKSSPKNDISNTSAKEKSTKNDLSNTLSKDKTKKNEFSNNLSKEKTKPKIPTVCFECKKDITRISSTIYKDRASHYMEYTNKVYTCPICLFTLPTNCGLKAHLRIHLKIPPFYCPECGIHMPNKNVIYPFHHDCEGFKMMRATTRHPCPTENCIYFHPNDFKAHMKDKHLKKIFSCPACVVASFNELTMRKHIKSSHGHNQDALIFFQCEMCPGRLVMQNHIESHLNNHKPANNMYPCWYCCETFREIPDLIKHYLATHDHNDELKEYLEHFANPKKVYRVVKRCDRCMRNFTYKCNYEDINVLPNACPFNCTPLSQSLLKHDNVSCETIETKIKCPLCNSKISESWADIKKHFVLYHKDHRCVDGKISLTKINVNKFLKKGKNKKDKTVKRNIKAHLRKERKQGTLQYDDKIEKPAGSRQKSTYVCEKCQNEYGTKETLETHIVTEHRDPCMAYQCMECGDCFVGKPSFSIHMLFHGVSNIDEYIKNKQCFNENAFNKCLNDDDDVEEPPLEENQCKICREQFDDTDELEKHFRVHGMAFLMKNSLHKSAPT